MTDILTHTEAGVTTITLNRVIRVLTEQHVCIRNVGELLEFFAVDLNNLISGLQSQFIP